MARTIKSKIALGIGLLFVLLTTISVVSLVFINLLSAKTENLLTANYKTIQYCNQMMHEINTVHLDGIALETFEKNLVLQEKNVTEPGESVATIRLRQYFELIKKRKTDSSVVDSINKQLFEIALLNQHALEKKNQQALATATKAKMWISLLGTLIIITSLTFLINFPGYIANPIRMLTEGIKEIAEKNYGKRIYLDNKDEFGEMASAFNQMAQKLFEYEHSSIHKILSEKQRLDTIINQMQDGIIGVNADNKILFMNTMAEQLLSLNAGEIKGRYAPDVALRNDLFRYILQKNKPPQPLKIVIDGRENYFSVANKTIYSEGETIGELFMLSNITSLKELDISKTNLLATISHELKTPVSSIKMGLKLLTSDKTHQLTADQQQLINGINEDTERILRITTELLNMTQIETGHIQFNKEMVSATQLSKVAVQAVVNTSKEKNVSVRTEVSDTLPEFTCDPEKTSWVLINFLTNAIRYSPAGKEVILSAELAGHKMQFSVRDFGKGIDEQYHDGIFKQFYQVPGRDDKVSSGLGLSISKQFIEAQGGEIWFESEPGKGSVFFFTIPV